MSTQKTVFRGFEILLVDDEPEICMLLSDFLKMRGANVDEANNGLEALALYKKKEYDLIITDLMMPKMDGKGFLENMQKTKISMTPVIVQSAVGTIQEAYALLDTYKIADFLEKPFRLDRFKFAVSSALEKYKLYKDLQANQEESSNLNSYLENIIDNMSEILIVVDYQAKIKRVNKSVTEILGYSEEELVGLNLDKIYDNTQPETPFLITANNGKLPVMLSEITLEKFNPKSDHLYLASDISALKSAQSQVIQTSKLAALGEMATGVAHEINQPLSFINGLFFVLQEDLEEDIPLNIQQTIEDLKEGKAQVARITEIIDHMRTFGRDNTRSMSNICINSVVNDSLLLIRERLRLKRVNLVLDLPEISPQVYGNGTQLEQVFINLIQNAVDAYSGEKGDVKLAVSEDLTNKKVVIKVQDFGTGIPDNIKERIFDPFFTTKGIQQGTGLGLSTSYGIIEGHKGHIDIDSVVEVGSTFIITLPMAPDVA